MNSNRRLYGLGHNQNLPQTYFMRDNNHYHEGTIQEDDDIVPVIVEHEGLHCSCDGYQESPFLHIISNGKPIFFDRLPDDAVHERESSYGGWTIELLSKQFNDEPANKLIDTFNEFDSLLMKMIM